MEFSGPVVFARIRPVARVALLLVHIHYAMYRLAIFASGSGSNARKIMEHFADGTTARVVLVVTNRKEAGVIDHADRMGVEWTYLPKDVFQHEGDKVLEILEEHKVDFVILAGFLLLMPKCVVKKFSGRMVNIHPALLPDFGGPGMYGDRVHAAVLESGNRRSGITIHYVDEHYDRGDILFSAEVEIPENETVEGLRTRVQKLEHAHYAQVIEDLLKKMGKKKEEI